MLPNLPILEPPKIEPIAIVIQEKQTEPYYYLIQPNDTISSIANATGVTAQRLFDKNTHIENPDLITVGQVIIIPAPDEQLTSRPLPTTIQPKTPAKQAVRSSGVRSSGGGYTAGQCTAYAWSRRPDLPGNLGSANTWYSRAKSQGYSVGSVPRAGAIAQATTGYMHVAYVEKVNSDGTIFISEQNYKGAYIVSSRTAPSSAFLYIY